MKSVNPLNNPVQNLINQQYGNRKWKFYDDPIKRLRSTAPTNKAPICDTPIFACKFAQQQRSEHLLALASEGGTLAIHNIRNEERHITKAHNNAIFDLAWQFDNMKIVTASGDHTARLFDITESDIRKTKVFYGHSGSIKTVAFRRDDPSVFATGGRDGNVIIWDTRTDATAFIGRADRTILNPHNVKGTPSKTRKKFVKNATYSPSSGAYSGAKSVTGLVFQDYNTLVSCGAGDGVIKIWDLRKNYLCHRNQPVPKATIPYNGSTTKNGFSSLIMDKNCLKLYANCLDNTIYCYNLNNYSPIPLMKYTGHQNSTFYIKSCLSQDGLYLISGSSDENAYIWNTKFSSPFVKLTGHTAEVTCVTWCERDDITAVTCSDDTTHKIWRVGSEELPENWPLIGKGKAEILPLISSSCKLKRQSPELEPVTPKKLALSCDKCGVASANKCCENCVSSKRKGFSTFSGEAKRAKMELEPRKLFGDLTQTESLVGNLPNFAIDGVAPHLNKSPTKQKDKDWLTKLRIQRQFRRDMDVTSEPPMKIAKVERKCSPQSPILRFFKVKCEGHLSNKGSPSTSALMSSPQSTR